MAESGGLFSAGRFVNPFLDDRCNRRPRLRGGDPLNRVPRRDIALTDHLEVEPGPPALEEPVLDVVPPEPDPELEAREARVRGLEDRCPGAVPVPHVDVRLEESL